MKNSGKKLIFHLKSWTFTENPCLILRKTRFFFTGSAAAVKNVKIEQFCFIFLRLFAFWAPQPRDTRILLKQ